MSHPTSSARTILEALFAAIDYDRLGPVYCDEGGAAFWEAHREPALRLGLEWAYAVAARVTDGASLYVGAGVAELPALVVEVSDLGRTVHVCSLNEVECQVLNDALRAVGLEDRIVFECRDAAEIAPGLSFDHLSLVSVLNDPVLYPMVSGLSYGRLAPVLLDVPEFEAERNRLRGLVGTLFDGLRRPGLITTTFEEVSWLLDAASNRGLTIEADDDAIETAIVGDPIGFLCVTD